MSLYYFFIILNKKTTKQMKRFKIFSFLIAIVLAGCSDKSKTYKTLIETDKLLDTEQYVSAKNKLSTIKSTDIKNEEESAYYNLLLTNTLFCLNEKIASDSAIDISINFYEKSKNAEKAARALYYKGMIMYENGFEEEGLKYVKRAEITALHSKSLPLLNKIYINLAYINIDTENYNTALYYAKKSLETAKLTENKNMTAISLNKINTAFLRLYMIDSAAIYAKKTIPYIKYLRKDEQPDVLTNISASLANIGETEQAVLYAKKSLQIKATAHAYYLLGSIYSMKGENDKAWQLWSKAANTEELPLKAEVKEWMAELKKEQGDYAQAAELSAEANAIKENIKQIKKAESMLAMQSDMEKNEMIKNTSKWQNIMIITVSVLTCILAALAAYHRIRIKNAQSIISEHQARIEKYAHKIERITASGKQNEREINRLKRKIDSLREEETSILSLGRKLHDDIRNGGTAAKWSKKDYEAFVEHCRIEHPELTEAIEKKHQGLTAYNIFFLMLCIKGTDNSEIQRIMGITPGAVRTLKYRLKGKGEEM